MKRKRKFKLSHVIFIVSALIISIIVALAFYLSYNFKVGDFVYNEDTGLIGEVKGISLPTDYVVQWQDGSFSQESLFDIKKLSELSDVEVMELLEEDNRAYYFYPGEVKGKGEIIFETTETEEKEKSEFNTGKILIPRPGFSDSIILRTGDEGCNPNYICNSWGRCQTEYDLYSLISEELISGRQYRYCRDYSECMSDLIDSRECEIKVPIEIKKVEIDGKEQLEIYDKEKDKLVAKIKETQLENFKKLDIELVV